jgi:hypothetical protein
MLIDLKGEWWNVDQIAKIEPFFHQGLVAEEPTEVVYMATLSTGDKRGITEEEFSRIINLSNGEFKR